VPSYRIFFLDQAAHISKPAVVLECDNDDQAIKQAKKYTDDHDIELWRGAHLVSLLQRRRPSRG
jgi:hypothetical protein